MIYFDNAATSFPKPVCVINEVTKSLCEYSGNAGRGSHYLSKKAEEKIFDVRCSLARMFGAESAENVVFTMNTTYALNIAVNAFLKRGSKILISDMEHNSVLRPVHKLYTDGICDYGIFDTFNLDDDSILNNIKKQIDGRTKMLVCRFSSNICSSVLPIEKIGRLCRENNIVFIVDGAQGAGVYDINVRSMNIDALCIPAHKGLMGPQGCGCIIFGDIDIEKTNVIISGGGGSDSLNLYMSEYLPDRFEAGTLPLNAVAGLGEGIKYIDRVGLDSIRKHENRIASFIKKRLTDMENVTVYAPEYDGSVVLFNINGRTSTDVAGVLDKNGICTRAGFHCAPLSHRTLKTGKSGAVRVSIGAFNTIKEAEYFVDCVNRMRR